MNRFLKSASLVLLGAFAVLTLAATNAVTVRNDSNGYLVGTASSDKVAFRGKAPVVMPSSADQAALTDSTGGSVSNSTLAAVTAPSALTDSTTGTASTTLASISDTPTKNAIASLAARQAENRAAIVALTDAVAKITELVNAERDALVKQGLMRGSAAP